jgi:pimeloyl-ACP methyl ester carboxylesterase
METPQPAFRMILSSFIRRGHDDAVRAAESMREHWPGYAHRHGRAAFLHQIRSLRTQDTLDVAGDLTRLDVPAAVVWGADDTFQKLAYGRRLATDLHAELDAIDGARHFVPEVHPDRVARAIAGVLERGA